MGRFPSFYKGVVAAILTMRVKLPKKKKKKSVCIVVLSLPEPFSDPLSLEYYNSEVFRLYEV